MVGSAAYSAASAIVVVMAKGKGRGGRGGPSGANKVSERRPPRITSNVKQSLRILKFWKVQALLHYLFSHMLKSVIYSAALCIKS